MRDRAQRLAQIKGVLVELGRAYIACMGLALLFHWFLGDASALFFAANSLALYFFVPLPLLLGLALWSRRRELWIGAIVLCVAWLWHWGNLWSPSRLKPPNNREAFIRSDLRVATYNLLGFNQATESTIRELRLAQADLVSLQELNPEMAAAIERELAADFPYRRLDPREGVYGGGVLSRWPLEKVETNLERVDGWLGTPIVSRVNNAERSLYFVQFHTASGPARFKARERQAEALRDFARNADLPVVAAGDFNATDMSNAYAIVRETLADSWAEVGYGFGHTFPGEPGAEVGGSRPDIAGIPVPKWLIRIDFIFHSPQLVAESAKTIHSFGGSDHRMVVAEFGWRALPGN
ncbi:MAG: endonuclease/exonuclease/phosphatase family protein [Polyangiaceae bacterium]